MNKVPSRISSKTGEQLPGENRQKRLKVPPIRWMIALMLFLAALLNYVDRSVLGLLAPTIQKDLGVSDAQYAMIVNFFLIAYTIAFLLSGRIVDRLGTRIGMALFVTWWSVANALTGFVRSVWSLGIFRSLLGLGEAGGYTASPKAVSEWFPTRERGLVIGIYSAGSSIGATIAPILVIFIAGRFGWQGAFVVTGLAGLLWVGPWLWLHRYKNDHSYIAGQEQTAEPAIQESTPEEKVSELQLWGTVLRQPAAWILMIARLMTDAIWYFYLFWMSKYLYTVRHVAQKDLSIMWVIFVGADIGFIAGGFLSGLLIKRGIPAPASRLKLMLVSACLIPLLPLVPLAPTVQMCLAVSVVIVLAHTSWLSNLGALVVDIFPKRILGTTFGVIAGGSALGGILMNQLVVMMINDYSYNHVFYILAFAHPIALLLVWRLRRAKEVN